MLPNLPYRENYGEKQIDVWSGLNRREGAQDGELTACENLSSRKYPLMCPRLGRSTVGTYKAPSALFAWDKLVVVDSGVLYYDDQPIENVTSGEKQFAVVNTKLCIFPDKKYIDLTNNTFGSLEGSIKTTGAVAFTENSVTAKANPYIKQNVEGGGVSGSSTTSWVVYTYGRDPSALSWSQSDGWTKPDGTLKARSRPSSLDTVSTGDIFIPRISGNAYLEVLGTYVADSPSQTSLPDTTQENNQGYYGIYTGLVQRDGVYYGTYDIFRKGYENPLFSGTFKVGDRISISGSAIVPNNVEKAQVMEIDDKANTVIFPDGTFLIPDYYYTLIAPAPGGSCIFWHRMPNDNYAAVVYSFDTINTMPAGTFIYVLGDKLYEYNGQTTNEISYTKTTPLLTNLPTADNSFAATAYTGSETRAITITRPVPDLDYICECNNRLWGVTNSEENEVWNAETKTYDKVTSRVIYASALGDPGNFYAYDGLSTDSYAVAVSSRGDFTDCVAYSGSVLCFKEDKLHRIAGSYPAEFYMYTDDIEGVQAGSHKASRIINEVLYYKGSNGVYAYTGGQPQLISYKLGGQTYTNAAAGADGTHYIISMKDSAGKFGLYEYDAIHDIWYKQDDTDAVDFAFFDNKIYMATGAGVFCLNNAAVGDTKWRAELAIFDEDAFERKQYRWIRILADIPAGGTLAADIAIDGRAPVSILKASGKTGRLTFNIPVPQMRAERMQLILSGTGDVAVRSVRRDIHIGSERV